MLVKKEQFFSCFKLRLVFPLHVYVLYQFEFKCVFCLLHDYTFRNHKDVINFRGHRSVSGLEVDWGVNFTLIVKCMIVYTLFHKKKEEEKRCEVYDSVHSVP